MQTLNEISSKLNFILNPYNILNMISMHVGEYKLSSKSSDFNGWLLCDGRSLDRTVYKELFEVIGTSFGSDNDQSFNLPDFRGRVFGAIGDGNDLSCRSLGDVVGAEMHTLTSDEMPTHSHSGTTGTSGTHTHTTNAVGTSIGLAVADGSNTVTNVDSSGGELNVWTTPRELTVNSSGDHTHAFTTLSTGSNAAHNNMQPTLFGGNVFIFSANADPMIEPMVT
jgi:microcystin-dependent protein